MGGLIIRGCVDPKGDPKFATSGCGYEDDEEDHSCWIVCTESHCNMEMEVYHDEPESTTTTTTAATTMKTSTSKSTTSASSTEDTKTDGPPVTDGAIINALSLFTVILFSL